MVYIKIAWRVVKYVVVKIMQDLGTNASAPTIDSLHKSTVKNGSLVSLPSCPEECEAVFQRFLPLSILALYKQKDVVSLSAYGKTILTRALASPN